MNQRERAETFRKRYRTEEELEQEKFRMRQERLRRKRRRIVIERALIVSFTCIGAVILVLIVKNATALTGTSGDDSIAITSEADVTVSLTEKASESVEESSEAAQLGISHITYPDWIDQQFLTINEYSRPNIPIEKVNDIAIHYVGNPGTSAQQNRDYFESLASTKAASASAHFIVGLDGEIIQAIPLNEKSYCTNHRNFDTISIEVCHPTADGKFNEKTYQSLIKLVAWLMEQLDLDSDHMIRHYDVTGKLCPKYYVEHEDAWLQMKADVKKYMKDNPSIQ